MVDSTDMSTPVTRGELRRGELREELGLFKQELREEFRQLEQKLKHLATKAEPEIWGGALLARIEHSEERLLARIERSEQRIQDSEQRLHAELARHTRAVFESMSTLIAASDDKYSDLPGRVNRLEVAVFEPDRR